MSNVVEVTNQNLLLWKDACEVFGAAADKNGWHWRVIVQSLIEEVEKSWLDNAETKAEMRYYKESIQCLETHIFNMRRLANAD